MGLGLFLLEQVRFRYSLRDLSAEMLVLLLALLFLPMGIWFGRQLYRQKKATGSGRETTEHLGELPEISKREKEVLELICRGMSNQEIADALFISLTTVKSHVSNLFLKFDVKRRTQLIHHCRKNGLFR